MRKIPTEEDSEVTNAIVLLFGDLGFIFVSEDVEAGTATLSIENTEIKFNQKTAEEHKHAYKDSAESMELIDADTGLVDGFIHYNEAECDPYIHRTMKKVADEYKDHVYGDDNKCTICGCGKWYQFNYLTNYNSNSFTHDTFYIQSKADRITLPNPPAGFDCWGDANTPAAIIEKDSEGKYSIAGSPEYNEKMIVLPVPLAEFTSETRKTIKSDFNIIYEPCKRTT